MKKTTIIRCVKRNIEEYGSLFSKEMAGCVICKEADKRFNPDFDPDVYEGTCMDCPLWDYIPTSNYSCSGIVYKGRSLLAIDCILVGNRPALRALLNGLITRFGKEEIKK